MKFISSYYNDETGESTVILQHLGKKFIGHSKIHPEEFDKKSEFAGCSYADMRATIQGLKYERRILKDEIKTIKNFIKACECYNNFDKDSTTAKVLYRQINQRNKKIKILNEWIVSIEKTLNNMIVKRANFLDKIKEAKENIAKKDN